MQVMLSAQEGGAETFFVKLALALAERGVVQQLVISPCGDRTQRLREAGCDVIELRAQGWRKALAGRKLQLLADKYQPTHVLTWMNRASSRMPQGEWVKLARLGGFYHLKNYQRCEYLIGNTPQIVTYLQEKGWPVGQAKMISNFGETRAQEAEGDCREELGLKPDDCVMLSLGRLHEVKAQDVAIRALVDLPKAVLLLAGEGALQGQYEALANDLGVADRVRFLGWRQDVARLFATCDLCVFPSRYEPLGNVVLEAWANCKPIVAAKSQGPEWLIEHQKTGWLFEIDSVAGLVAGVKAIRDDHAFVEHLVAQGEREFRERFSKEVIVKSYLDFFEECERSPSEREDRSSS